MFGCLLVLFGLLAPRLALVLVFLFTDWFSAAYATVIWPVLGFIFAPYTALAVLGANLHGGIRGSWLILVIAAVVVDVLNWSGSGHHYRRRPTRRVRRL